VLVSKRTLVAVPRRALADMVVAVRATIVESVENKPIAVAAGALALTMVSFLAGFLCLLLPWDEELLIAAPKIAAMMLPRPRFGSSS